MKGRKMRAMIVMSGGVDSYVAALLMKLLKNTHGISNTMLSKTTKELEDDGSVERSEYLEVPIRVEYNLTDKARRLQSILTDLIRWALRDEETE